MSLLLHLGKFSLKLLSKLCANAQVTESAFSLKCRCLDRLFDNPRCRPVALTLVMFLLLSYASSFEALTVLWKVVLRTSGASSLFPVMLACSVDLVCTSLKSLRVQSQGMSLLINTYEPLDWTEEEMVYLNLCSTGAALGVKPLYFFGLQK